MKKRPNENMINWILIVLLCALAIFYTIRALVDGEWWLLFFVPFFPSLAYQKRSRFKKLRPEAKAQQVQDLQVVNIQLFASAPTLPLRRVVPGLEEIFCCPLRSDDYDPHCSHNCLYEQIVHLNDHHGWTREQIADWLDTLDVDLSFSPDTVCE